MSAVAQAGTVPASRKEHALWLLETFVPDSGVNNLSMAFRIDGELRLSALTDTLNVVLARHEVLRTVFHATDAELTKQLLPALDIEIAVLDPVADTVDDDLRPFIAAPFRCDGTPLLRAAYVPRSDGDVFCLAVHHSIFDGVSTMILLHEFTRIYDALVSGHQPPAELCTPMGVWTEPEPTAKSEVFWRAQLDGFTGTDLDLGCQRSAGSQVTLTGQVVTRDLSPAVKTIVARLQRELRAPEAVILLAAYYVLLAAHGAGPDLTVGSPVSVRDRTTVGALGYHINVLTIRAAVDNEQPFRALVVKLRRTFLTAMEHADYPVDDLVETIPRAGSAWRNLLFRHVFNYAPMGGSAPLTAGGRQVEQLVIENGASKFDLEFFVSSLQDGLRVRAAFYTDVFDTADVESMIERYEALLLSLEKDFDRPVGELDVWSDRDRAVIGAANATTRSVTPNTVLSGFADAVSANPAEVAVVDGDRRIDYRTLWNAAAAVRDQLTEHGVGAGDVVALTGRRGPELAAAAFGVWLAGAVYLPLDPDHPAQRIAYELTDSGARIALAGAGIEVPGDLPVLCLPDVDTAPPAEVSTTEPAAADRAYLIYTSGSTGLPKGTLVSHGALANLIGHFADALDADHRTTMLWLTTFSFDISALELFLPLVSGGRIVVAPDDARTDGRALREVLEQAGSGIMQATPTTWRLVLDDAAGALTGWELLSGGEPLPLAVARRLTATGCRVRNVYGPTETTIWSTSGIVDPSASRVDVGKPLANTQVFVAGTGGRHLPVGVRGELCVAGSGVAEGYHGRPELTAERFGEHPEYGRFYATGDLCRWLPDGRLELLGRADRQIKLRGNRIELGEVEAVLLAHAGVRAAAVLLAGAATDNPSLVAFVVPRGGDLPGDLWEHARASLPLPSVPAEFFEIEAFPMTGNDKVDYPALARLADERERPGEADATPADHADELVNVLVGLWRETLGRNDVGAESNFFASGGNSLLGAKLVQRIETETGVRPKLTELFEQPSPAALAPRLRAAFG
ncbi:hypothetical protein ALI144C_17090 [Actinosynnema sp. ALI-1.44]|uniref:non-ribosomal peptide synthetase n=1 Tax=Actinosynnema sp. ALI-1.44 TaxID=1933779 RepID=UPI00097BFF33|nr:non-ribosomal peptide synthetase [Actinosynnema sp. ALI-1.44]ONI83210.1 hypothetical protein ALI144C_17090 [Actinosynnema sp. ALI-1.44]